MTTPRVRPVAPEKSPVDLSMRARQLASTVRQGRKIHVTILDEYPIEGYLAGWDADTYFLVYTDNDQVFKVLIPKPNILKITLMDDRTFREEPMYGDMNDIVRPFRDLINNTYFKPESE